MFFIETKPSLKMRQLIQSLWWMEVDCRSRQESFSERVLPDGSSEIIFHLGDKVSRTTENNGSKREPDCFFIGQNTSQYDNIARGRVKMLGVKFQAHAASFLLREQSAQFNNVIVNLQDILGSSVCSLNEKIHEARTLESRFAIVENYFEKLVRNEKSSRFLYLDYAIGRIMADKGKTPLGKLARKIGVTNRYLEKLFLAHVGISPKLFAQIIQFQTSVQLMSLNETLSLTDVSVAAGYFDQSHFVRAVKRFTGVTPAELKREKMIMQKPFFDPLKA